MSDTTRTDPPQGRTVLAEEDRAAPIVGMGPGGRGDGPGSAPVAGVGPGGIGAPREDGSIARSRWTAPVVMEAIAWIGAIASLAVIARFAANGFWGDDWELLAASFRGAGAFDPIAAHLRPMVRLHFLLAHVTTSALVFHLVSLALHLAAACTAAALVTRLHDARTGRTAGLLFAAAFPANEAVYWVSAIGVIDCLLFSLAALWLWRERRPIASTVCLCAAALCYELWLIVPALFLFGHVRKHVPERHEAGIGRGWLRDWVAPGLLIVAFAAVTMARLGSGSATAYGGVRLAELPARLAVHAFRALAPWGGSPGTIVAILVLAALALLAWRRPPFRFPVLFYLLSAAILSLSDVAPSRFHYFPHLGVALTIALLAREGPILRWCGAALALYVLAAGVVFNARDGRDYRALSRLGMPVLAETRRVLAAASPGDAFVFVNRTGAEPLLRLASSVEGAEKFLFVRPSAVNGVVSLEDLVTIALGERGLRNEASPCRGTQIDIGAGPPVARSCFTVATR